MTYLRRRGWEELAPADPAAASSPTRYAPGDLVAWRFPDGRLHVGVVSDRRTAAGRPLIIHNAGQGAVEEDVLFEWRIIGHFRWQALARPGS
jgi:uncharacterized protein YijF (DUF1287 family)